jgi:hypothetical protein
MKKNNLIHEKSSFSRICIKSKITHYFITYKSELSNNSIFNVNI